MTSVAEELAVAAARLVVEEGLDYGPAKRKAARLLGRRSPRPAEWPDNDALDVEVRSYLALYCADTQPAELAALREVAATWMQRLAEFRPHLTGAVWRGTATRLNNIHLQLFCDDAKAAEITLIDQRIAFDVTSMPGPRGEPVDVLRIAAMCHALGEPVTLLLSVLDHDDLRGALKPDASGQPRRGDLAALRKLLDSPS